MDKSKIKKKTLEEFYERLEMELLNNYKGGLR